MSPLNRSGNPKRPGEGIVKSDDKDGEESSKEKQKDFAETQNPLPEIPSVPPEIIEAVNKNQLAVFIGAGASRVMGYPGWSTLAEMVIDACRKYVEQNTLDASVPPQLWEKCARLAKGELGDFEKTGIKKAKDPKKALSVCHQLFKDLDHEKAFFECAANCLRIPSGSRSPDDIYEEIYGLRGFYLTTNADPEFDRIFSYKTRFELPEDPANQVDRTELYHLHGSVEKPESMILTTPQYLSRYRAPLMIKFLRWIFANNVVLFLGYGLGEYEVLDFLLLKEEPDSGIREPAKKFVLRDYNLDKEQDPDIDELYYKSLGVTLIPYRSESESETSLIRVIKNWREEIASRSAVLFLISRRLAKAAASFDENEVDWVLQTTTEPKHLIDFFKQLKESDDPIAWLERLDQGGFLELRTWFVFSYLEKVAIQNETVPSADITSIIIDHIDTGITRQKDSGARVETQSIDELILKILFHLPNEKDVRDRCGFLRFALEMGDDGAKIAGALFKEIIPKVLEREWKGILLEIFDLILDADNRESEEKANHGHSLWEFCLRKACLKFAKPATELCGRELATRILEKIEKSVGDESRSCHYGRRVRSLTESPENQMLRSQTEILVRFLVEVGFSLKIEDLIRIVTELQTADDVIFHRIALALIDVRFPELRQFLTEWPGNLFEEYLLERELYPLLESHAREFTEREVDRLAEWIESSDYGSWSEWEEKEREYYLAGKRKKWYQALEQSSHPRVNEGLRIASIIHPDPVRVDLKENATLTLIEPTEEDLEPLRGLTTAELARILDEKYGASHEFHSMTADMEDIILQLVSKNPSYYSSDLNPFVLSSPRVHYGLLRGFEEAWKEKRFFSWVAVLAFIERILVTERYAVLEPHTSNSIQSWVIGSIGSLLLSAVQSDDRALDVDLLPRAYTLLRSLAFRNPEAPSFEGDRFHQSWNSSQGRLLRALIDTARHSENISANAIKTIGMSDLLFDLHALLLDPSHISADYLTVIGWYYCEFFNYNTEWTMGHHSVLFPRDQPSLWGATMIGLLYRPNAIWSDIFVHLKESGELMHAISFEIADHDAASQLPRLICSGYNTGLDPIEAPGSLIRTLVQKGTPEQLEQIHGFYHRRIDEEIDSDELERIRAIWRLIMNRFLSGDDTIRRQVSEFSSWLSLFDRMDPEIEGWMHVIVDNFEGGFFAESYLLDALKKHVDREPVQVKDILMRFLKRSNTLSHIHEEEIQSIVEKLFEFEQGKIGGKIADPICSFFKDRNAPFLQEIFFANHPELRGYTK